MIHFENVTKKFGSKTVLNNISFVIKPGEFVAVTGPSGSGKTTLINLLLGADMPSSGKIRVSNYDVHSLDEEKLQEYRRNLGVIFQDCKLLPRHTVFENVAYALTACETPPHEMPEKIKYALESVGLKQHQDLYPHQLSGGEAQRAALCRAIVHSPSIILADEPTGNLDPENALAIMKLLLQMNLQGVTIVLATHDPELIKRSPKRIFELKEGKIIEI